MDNQSSVGARQSARGVLEDQRKRAERRVQALKILDNYIDWDELDKESEGLLWEFFVSGRFI